MKYASIVPPTFINQPYCSTNPDYHLLLASQVEEGNLYTKTYKNIDGTKYLDCDFFEKETGRVDSITGIDSLIEKAKLVKASHIVIPDMFFTDMQEFNDKLDELASVIPNTIKLVGVVAAFNLLNAIECFKELNENNNIHTVAIPDRMLSRNTKISRVKFLNKIVSLNLDKIKPVHLMALDNFKEFPAYIKYPFVVGLDSTILFKNSLFYSILTNNEDFKRPKEYFDVNFLQSEQKAILKMNWQILNNFLNGKLKAYHIKSKQKMEVMV